jgi:hypothetical protein
MEATLAVRPLQPSPTLNVLLTIGMAWTHIDARQQEATLVDCTPFVGCMAEGVVTYHTGTYFAWGPGVALEIPIAGAFAVRPHARLLLTRDDPTWGTQAVIRLDLGVAWRP